MMTVIKLILKLVFKKVFINDVLHMKCRKCVKMFYHNKNTIKG